MAGELFGDMVQETRTGFDANKSRNSPYGSHGNMTILTGICIVLAQQNIILRGSRFCFLRSIEISPQDAVTERRRVSSWSICSLENYQIIWILRIRENSNKKNATIVLAIGGNNWNESFALCNVYLSNNRRAVKLLYTCTRKDDSTVYKLNKAFGKAQYDVNGNKWPVITVSTHLRTIRQALEVNIILMNERTCTTGR